MYASIEAGKTFREENITIKNNNYIYHSIWYYTSLTVIQVWWQNHKSSFFNNNIIAI